MTDLDTTRLAYSGRVPDAAEQARRVRRHGTWYATENYLRQARAWLWTILATAIGTPLLYMLAMGVGLGSLLDARGTTVDGVSYLVFVAPGIMAASAAQGAFGETTYPVMAGFKWARTYHGPAATPLDPRQLAWGMDLGLCLRFGMQSLIFWLVMLLFGATTSPWSWLAIPVATLTALATATPMQAYAASLEEDEARFTSIQRFVLMPMFLFAGTFFALDSMPIYLQWIGWVSPIWHGSQLARIASYGMTEPLWLSLAHVVFLLALALGGAVAAGRVYRRRLWT